MRQKFMMALFAITLFASPAFSQDSTISNPGIVAYPAIPVVDTINTFDVGGTQYYVIADKLDSLYANVRVVVSEVKEAKPQKTVDWLMLFIKLLSSGVLASLFSQGMKIFNDAKDFISKMPSSEWVVLLASTIIGGGWLYLDTKFDAFEFSALFYRVSGVFMVAIVVWKAGLNRLFAKKANPVST